MHKAVEVRWRFCGEWSSALTYLCTQELRTPTTMLKVPACSPSDATADTLQPRELPRRILFILFLVYLGTFDRGPISEGIGMLHFIKLFSQLPCCSVPSSISCLATYFSPRSYFTILSSLWLRQVPQKELLAMILIWLYVHLFSHFENRMAHSRGVRVIHRIPGTRRRIHTYRYAVHKMYMSFYTPCTCRRCRTIGQFLTSCPVQQSMVKYTPL